jgi:hypothetical protein
LRIETRQVFAVVARLSPEERLERRVLRRRGAGIGELHDCAHECAAGKMSMAIA